MAAGNNGNDQLIYPAAHPGVLTIGAADGNQIAGYSSYGDHVEIYAPGSAGGSQGTSVATAYVAHIAAKYQRIHPEASPADVLAALKKAAGDDGFLTEDAVRRMLIR